MRYLMMMAMIACSGCEPSDTAPATCAAGSGRLVITADYLARSLTLLDHARLLDERCDADETIVDRVDLGDYPPGPLEVELSPDGTLAIVAVGPGFLPAGVVSSSSVEPGGTVLVVDIAARAVIHAIDMPEPPMGLAITPDGRHALSANYGDADVEGRTLSVIDIEAGEIIADYDVGARPEQVVISADGKRGLVNAAEDDTVRSFSIDGAELTLSDPLVVGSDPSDVAFVSGDRAVVTSSLALGYSLIDTSAPQPTLIGEFSTPSGVPYGVTSLADGSEILVTTFLAGATVLHSDISGDTPTSLAEIRLEGSAFTLGAMSDGQGHAFVPQPNDQRLSIVDLERQSARSLQWLDAVGPTYVAIQP